MAEEIKTKEMEDKKKIDAKPLPVNKEKAKEIERQFIEKFKEAKKNEENKAGQKPLLPETKNLVKVEKDSSVKEKLALPGKEKIKETEKELSEKSKEKTEPKEEKKEVKKQEKKKDSKPKVKKYEAVAYGRSMPISRKQGAYISSFIKSKTIDNAISDLTLVINFKKIVPFKGEIPHRKGKGMSGRYPIKASKLFINVLKSLKGNVLVNGMELEKTRISMASATWAARPMRSGGRSAKRTNLILKAKEFEKKK